MDHRRLNWLCGSVALPAVVGVGSGLASALFLEALHAVTDVRVAHPWLLFVLPLAGAGIAWLYAEYGAQAAGGNNLILDQIHTPQGAGVPLRMFPLVLFSTLVTHLFGGSAGREGTAVQMGGSIAGSAARWARIDPQQTRLLLMSGISGGFASVFGTPLAGAVFGMEMLAVGGMRYEALIPCLVAAIVGDATVRGLGIAHANYAVTAPLPPLEPTAIATVAVAGVAFGLASALFSEMTALVEREARALVSDPVRRTAVGGLAVVVVSLLLGTREYNGLSLPLLSSALDGEQVPTFAFLFKLVLTALTLGVGFKGGEVTPLFVIGATLGAVLAGPLGASPQFLAPLGFVAVFAAAANTPIACVIMGIELFGGQANAVAYFGIAVFIAYTISGHRGIYHAQRVLMPKRPSRTTTAAGAVLRDVHGPRHAYSVRLVRRHRERFGTGAPHAPRTEHAAHPATGNTADAGHVRSSPTDPSGPQPIAREVSLSVGGQEQE